MIPYDELVAALAGWRARQGLPSGPADYLGEPVHPSHADALPAAAYADDVVDLSEDMVDSVVEEQSSRYGEVEEYSTSSAADTQDHEVETYLEAAPEVTPPPEEEPDPSAGRRKRRR